MLFCFVCFLFVLFCLFVLCFLFFSVCKHSGINPFQGARSLRRDIRLTIRLCINKPGKMRRIIRSHGSDELPFFTSPRSGQIRNQSQTSFQAAAMNENRGRHSDIHESDWVIIFWLSRSEGRNGLWEVLKG